MQANRTACMCYLILSICFIACEDEALVIKSPNGWGVPSQALVMDTCFSPLRQGNPPRAFRIVPEVVGNEIHKIAFDPFDDNALYITTWQRRMLGVPSVEDSDLYRLDLRDNSSSFITRLRNLGRRDLILNGQAELLSPAMGEGTTIFNLSSLELTAENLTENTPSTYSWANDSSFWSPIRIFHNGRYPRVHWLLTSKEAAKLDTLAYAFSHVSAARNQLTVFTCRVEANCPDFLYIFDQSQGIFLDSMQAPSHPALASTFRTSTTPLWLNEHQLLLPFFRVFLVADFETKSYEAVKVFPEECKNYEVSSVQVVPNRPNEVLYVLNRYFFDELGAYRRRHELVHLNLETRDETVLLIDL